MARGRPDEGLPLDRQALAAIPDPDLDVLLLDSGQFGLHNELVACSVRSTAGRFISKSERLKNGSLKNEPNEGELRDTALVEG